MIPEYIPYKNNAVSEIADQLEKRNGYMLRAFWLLGVELGLTNNELLAVRVSEIKEDCIAVDNAEVRLSPLAKRIVKRLMHENPDRVFLFQSNRTEKPTPISNTTVKKAFNELQPILGFKVTPSMARQVLTVRVFLETSDKDEVRKRLRMSGNPPLNYLDKYLNTEDNLMKRKPYSLVQQGNLSLTHDTDLSARLTSGSDALADKLSKETRERYLSVGVIDDVDAMLTTTDLMRLTHPGAVVSAPSINSWGWHATLKGGRVCAHRLDRHGKAWMVFTPGTKRLSNGQAAQYLKTLLDIAKGRLDTYFNPTDSKTKETPGMASFKEKTSAPNSPEKHCGVDDELLFMEELPIDFTPSSSITEALIIGLLYSGKINCITTEQLISLEPFINDKGLSVVPINSTKYKRLLFKINDL